MEKTTISEEKRNDLIIGFKKMRDIGLGFIILGIIGVIPIISIIVGLFGNVNNLNPAFYPPYTAGFVAIGIIFMGQAENATKKIKNNDYQVYKTKCVRKKFFNEYAVVENNEVLSNKVSKPVKSLTIIGSHKSINDGNEIGILHVDKKTFYAFALD